MKTTALNENIFYFNFWQLIVQTIVATISYQLRTDKVQWIYIFRHQGHVKGRNQSFHQTPKLISVLKKTTLNQG